MKQLYKTGKRLGATLFVGLMAMFCLPQANAAGNGATYTGTASGTCSKAYLAGEEATAARAIEVTVDYSVTWQTDGNLYIVVNSVTPSNIVGMVPKFNYEGVKDMTDNKYYTLQGDFSENQTVNFSFYLAYAGGADDVNVSYIVGSTNTSTGGDGGDTGNGETGGNEGSGATYTGTVSGTCSKAYLAGEEATAARAIEVTVDYSVTWQTDGNLYIVVNSVTPSNIVGMVPKFNYEGVKDMTDNKYYTLQGDFSENQTVNFSFYLAYAGGADDVNVSYIVGSTNTSTGGDTGDGGDTGGEGGGEEQPEEGNGTGAIYTGKTINGTLGDTEFTLAWTATWNKNETVTFSANINPTMPGMSPQILGLEENPVVLQLESGLYVYTTTATYKADEQIAANFFIAGENGVVSETMPFTYTVGSDANDNTGTGGGTEITPPAEGDKGNGETATGTILGVFEGATLPGEESTSDVAYEIVWSATWNLNGTVTFSFTITPWVVGLVPQISVGGSQFADLVSEGDNKYSFTTTGEYAEGTSPFALYMPYLGGVANVKMDYEVGASKDYTAIYRFDSSSTNAPVEFFNLAGQRVANPQHGVFIRKQGNKTSKVVIR